MANAIVLVADGSAKSIKHNQRLALEQNHLTVNSIFIYIVFGPKKREISIWKSLNIQHPLLLCNRKANSIVGQNAFQCDN